MYKTCEWLLLLLPAQEDKQVTVSLAHRSMHTVELEGKQARVITENKTHQMK
jgi:hypothetical protein